MVEIAEITSPRQHNFSSVSVQPCVNFDNRPAHSRLNREQPNLSTPARSSYIHNIASPLDTGLRSNNHFLDLENDRLSPDNNARAANDNSSTQRHDNSQPARASKRFQMSTEDFLTELSDQYSNNEIKVAHFLEGKAVAADEAVPGNIKPQDWPSDVTPPTFTRLVYALTLKPTEVVRWLQDCYSFLQQQPALATPLQPQMNGYDRHTGKTLLQLLVENYQDTNQHGKVHAAIFDLLLEFGANPCLSQFNTKNNTIETALLADNFHKPRLLAKLMSPQIAARNMDGQRYDIWQTNPAFQNKSSGPMSLFEWAKLHDKKEAAHDIKNNMSTAYTTLIDHFASLLTEQPDAEPEDLADLVDFLQKQQLSISDILMESDHREHVKSFKHAALEKDFARTLTHRLGCAGLFDEMLAVMQVEHGAMEADNLTSLFNTVIAQAITNDADNDSDKSFVTCQQIPEFIEVFFLSAQSGTNPPLTDQVLASLLIQGGIEALLDRMNPTQYEQLENCFKTMLEKLGDISLSADKTQILCKPELETAQSLVKNAQIHQLQQCWNQLFSQASSSIKNHYTIPDREIINSVFNPQIDNALHACMLSGPRLPGICPTESSLCLHYVLTPGDFVVP